MKSTILILYFIYFDFIYCQDDINAEDLKLLGNYEIQTLRDFVRGKGRGFVSKVSADRSAETSETSDDILFEERQAQAARSQSPPPFSIKMPPNINNQDDVIEVGQKPEMEMSKFEIVPLSDLLKPGESLVIPTFITPSTPIATTTERPRKRKKTRRPTTTTTEAPSTTEGPSNEDFEELAKILQRFRQSQTTPPPPPPPSTTPVPIPSTTKFHPIPKASIPRPHLRQQGLSTVVEQTIPDFQEFVVSPLREKWKGMASPLSPPESSNKQKNLFGEINIRPSKFSSPPPSTLPPTLIPMSEQPSDLLFPQKPLNGELVAITQEEWEDKMREISRKLGNYLMSVKKKKEQEGTLSKGSYQVNGVQQQQQQQQQFRPNLLNFGQGKTTSRVPMKHRTAVPKAYVTLLREGFFHQIESNQFSFVASITLIRDNGKIILVDTGLATDINGRTDLIQKLSKLNIAPPLVDYVITTHGHPDHSGNTNDFPDSIHYQGNLVHYRTKFNISELATSNSTTLTPNVKLIKTPGHTSEDISVIVSNTDKYGTIAISGDIFISDKDIDFPMMWKKFSSNIPQQEWSRRELICLANFIVPGHGKVFKVTSEMKNGVNCGRNYGIRGGRFN